MTTEIAVLNKHGIALAADSAVTVGRQRVWKSANKLFSLGPHNDIAIMTYGSGDFIGYPWEPIVKTFRAGIGARRFSTVAECSEAFIGYLSSKQFVNPENEQVSIALIFLRQLEFLKAEIEGKYKTKKEFRELLSHNLEGILKVLDNFEIVNSTITYEEISATYDDHIRGLAKEVLGEHIPKVLLKKLTKALYEVTRRNINSDYETGVVVAGFGETEFFPSLVTNVVDGKHKNWVRSWIVTDKSHDVNDRDESDSSIIAFGQADIATLFLEGIARGHTRWIQRTVERVLTDKTDTLCKNFIADPDQRLVEAKIQAKENAKIVRRIGDEFAKFRNKVIVQKIMSVVSTLPKEEMAAMAEALVELTSLRRKMDAPLETVGGPTDVALISKGDGLVWMKRKHYFDIALNGDFAFRKQIRSGGASNVEEREELTGEVKTHRSVAPLDGSGDGGSIKLPRKRSRRGGGTNNQRGTRAAGQVDAG